MQPTRSQPADSCLQQHACACTFADLSSLLLRPPDVCLFAGPQPKAVANSGSSESSVVHVPSFSRQTSLTTCLSVSSTHRWLQIGMQG
jgi:hypothetical protein